MQDAEDEVYLQALTVAHGVTLFTEVNPLDEEPPDEWVEKWGVERAQKLFEAAKYGHYTRKEAPIGVQMAVDMAKSERRARSNIEAGPKTLNVSVVAMPKFDDNYKIQEVED